MSCLESAAPALPTVEARTRVGIPERYLPAIAMIVAAILWGSAPVFTKIALDTFNPFALSAARWSLSLVLMTMLLRRSGEGPLLTRRVAATAVFGMVAFTVFFSYGVQRTTAANATLIHAATPMLISLLAAIVLGESLTRRRGAGIALSIAGVAVIVGGATIGGSLPGNVLVAVSACSWALFTVLSRRVVVGRNPLAVTAGMAVFGLILFIPAALIEYRVADADPLTWKAAITAVYLALGPSLAAYLLYGFALSRRPANEVAVWGNLGPVIGIAAAAIALGEPITRLHLLGGLLVFAGVYLANRRPSPPSRTLSQGERAG